MLDVLIDASPAARDSAQRCPFSDIHVGGAAVGIPVQSRSAKRYPRAERMAACTPVPWMAQKGVPAADVLRAG